MFEEREQFSSSRLEFRARVGAVKEGKQLENRVGLP